MAFNRYAPKVKAVSMKWSKKGTGMNQKALTSRRKAAHASNKLIKIYRP